MYRISFTGYRPTKLPFFGEDDPLCIALKNKLKEKIEQAYKCGATEFFSGMALGVDMWSAEAVLQLKEKYPEIKLTAVIPCRTQDAKWQQSERLRYRSILSRCDKTICISPEYTKDCMHRRNRALVDMCDILIAVFDGQSGGTKYTVDYAQKKGKKVVIIEPM